MKEEVKRGKESQEGWQGKGNLAPWRPNREVPAPLMALIPGR